MMYVTHPTIFEKQLSQKCGLGGEEPSKREGADNPSSGTDAARAAASAPSARSRRDHALPVLESHAHDDEPLAEHVQAVWQKQHRAKSTQPIAFEGDPQHRHRSVARPISRRRDCTCDLLVPQ
jgi:hypothetical protein